MRLTPRLTLTFLVYAATLLAVVGLLAYRSGRESLRAATVSELRSTTIEKEAALEEWVDEKRHDITHLAAHPAVLEHAAALQAADPGSIEAQRAHDRLLAEVSPLAGPSEFESMMVIDPDSGMVLASTDPAEEGRFKEDRPFFLRGRMEPFVQNLYYSISLGGPAMTAAAPLVGPEGNLLGVLAGRLNLEEMNAIVSRRTSLHESDDAFLVNTSNLFVTQPRFVTDPAVLQRGVQTEAVDRCLRQESGLVEADDYRGVPAFTVYTWMPERQLCLLVEMDQAEAYAPAQAFGATVAGISGLALFGAAALAVVLALSITRPVLALNAGAEKLGHGDLTVRLPEESRDELGGLARQFNRMAGSLEEKEARLRASWKQTQARLDRLADTNVIGIAVAGAGGEIFEANDYYLNLLGYTRQDLQAGLVRWTDRTPPEHLSADRRALAELEAMGACKPYDKEYFRKDGSRVWVTITDAILPQEGGKIMALVQDITERKRSEGEILESEERYRSLFESMVNGYAYCQILTDGEKPSDFVYIRVNKEFDRLTGLRDVEGRKVSEVIPGIQVSSPELFETFGRVALGGAPERFETYVEGLERWFDVSVYCSSPGFFVAIFDNITVRKRAERELQESTARVVALNRVASIVSASLELDKVYDAFVDELRRLLPVDRTSIVRLDPEARQWMVVRQWTSGESVVPVGEWHPVTGSVIERVVETARSLVESPIDPDNRWPETPILRQEGLHSRILVPLVIHGKVTGLITAACRKPNAYGSEHVALLEPMAAHLALAVENIRLYEAERQHAGDLERRVAERTAELETANKELEAFSYSVSHDLRAPLRAADGFSRILLEDYGPALDAEARRYLDLVRVSTQQMGRLIDDLLTFSRLSRQELACRPVRPSEAARRALEQLGHERTGRTVEVIVDEMPRIDADPNLLVQVYANLLANALKFTRKRESASIHVGARPVDGEPAYFVQDNGVGFDMKYAAKLFGVFQRLHRAEDYEGTGVGLAIVQRIVHRHGGRAWAEGAVDQGATFYFTIPERRDR